MTARWVVDEVAPRRDLNLVWQPISLLFKNDPDEGTDYYRNVVRGHQMLRIMEAIRTELGEGPVFDWYWLCATRIHHDRDRTFEFADALEHLGLDRQLADAADERSWDAEIRTRMDEGLELVGQDVGTPIIAFVCPDGTKRGIFGPVITKVPPTEQSLAVWDAMYTFTAMDGFWELKRTRNQRPEFGLRPDV